MQTCSKLKMAAHVFVEAWVAGKNVGEGVHSTPTTGAKLECEVCKSDVHHEQRECYESVFSYVLEAETVASLHCDQVFRQVSCELNMTCSGSTSVTGSKELAVGRIGQG